MEKSRIAHYQNKLQYEIDSWDLNQLIKDGKAVIILDVRSAQSYNKEHIAGAINFPHREINQGSVADLFSTYSPETEYVTYCDGIGCNASTKGALKLAELGYKVRELIGGIEWWKKDGYSVVKGS